ncbi:MAG TPA: M81 family metallopeptidase [Caulobacteraceae bacterium]|jgi:microcystin degradation protein MlrC|nr:M81 family metallopeptidase [Caulobacteraceae bacterium]
MPQKFVVAMMMHETNTFSPLPTPIEAFARRGALSGPSAIADAEGTNTPLGGFIDVARGAGAEFVVPVAGNAYPAGLVTEAAFEEMAGAIVAAVAAGCDAVMLALHGAMVTERTDDGEGELLTRIRAVAPDVPIAVALDFHSQMTEAMVRGATVMTGYRTYPHIDMAETSRRAGRTLLRALAGEVAPKIVWGSRPIMSSTLVHTPSREPMKSLMAMASAAEDSGAVLNASVFGGFPQADIPHLSLSSVVVCDGRTAEGELLLARILDEAWERREGFLFHAEPLSAQVGRAKALEGGPIILADHGDNTASGGTQDVMSVIEEAIRQELDDACAGPICDPACVVQMIAAGVGAEVTLELGGKVDMPAMGLAGKPLKVTGRVRAITDGAFTVTGPMATGSVIRMGRTAVLDTGRMQIVVSELRSEPYDLGVFTHCGIDPTRKRYVLIKSRQHFRAGFEPIARHIVMCDGDGCTASDLALFDYKNIRRPLYPFDMDMVLGRNDE